MIENSLIAGMQLVGMGKAVPAGGAELNGREVASAGKGDGFWQKFEETAAAMGVARAGATEPSNGGSEKLVSRTVKSTETLESRSTEETKLVARDTWNVGTAADQMSSVQSKVLAASSGARPERLSQPQAANEPEDLSGEVSVRSVQPVPWDGSVSALTNSTGDASFHTVHAGDLDAEVQVSTYAELLARAASGGSNASTSRLISQASVSVTDLVQRTPVASGDIENQGPIRERPTLIGPSGSVSVLPARIANSPQSSAKVKGLAVGDGERPMLPSLGSPSLQLAVLPSSAENGKTSAIAETSTGLTDVVEAASGLAQASQRAVPVETRIRAGAIQRSSVISGDKGPAGSKAFTASQGGTVQAAVSSASGPLKETGLLAKGRKGAEPEEKQQAAPTHQSPIVTVNSPDLAVKPADAIAIAKQSYEEAPLTVSLAAKPLQVSERVNAGLSQPLNTPNASAIAAVLERGILAPVVKAIAGGTLGNKEEVADKQKEITNTSLSGKTKSGGINTQEKNDRLGQSSSKTEPDDVALKPEVMEQSVIAVAAAGDARTGAGGATVVEVSGGAVPSVPGVRVGAAAEALGGEVSARSGNGAKQVSSEVAETGVGKSGAVVQANVLAPGTGLVVEAAEGKGAAGRFGTEMTASGAAVAVSHVVPVVESRVVRGAEQVSAEGMRTGSATPGAVSANGLEHTTLVATPNVLEVGVASGTNGWLKVRAEMDGAGGVSATVVASTASAVEALHKDLPALSAYLKDESVGVSSLVVNRAEAGAMAQNAASGSGPGSFGPGSFGAGSDSSGRQGEAQAQAVDSLVTESVEQRLRNVQFDATGAISPPAGYGAGSGGWLNVVA